MPSVLFVCTGNMIRSPIAEAAFRKKIISSNLNTLEWDISSAGTWTTDGRRIEKRAEKFAELHNLDTKDHRSRIITQAIINSSDLILVMHQGHKEALHFEFPHSKEKIYLISELNGPEYSFPDPINEDNESHTQILLEILSLIEKDFDTICSMALKSIS